MERTYKALDMNSPATQRAIARCRKQHPKVRCLSFERGLFVVSSSRPGRFYRVRLTVTPNGKFLPECHCKAGLADLICYHGIASAEAWIILANMRQTTEKLAASLGMDGAASEPGEGSNTSPEQPTNDAPEGEVTGENVELFCAECGQFLSDGHCERHPKAAAVTGEELEMLAGPLHDERDVQRRERENSILTKQPLNDVKLQGYSI